MWREVSWSLGVISVAVALAAAGCGTSPSTPTPVPTPTPPPPVSPPVVMAVTVGVDRVEVGDEVVVTAQVEDSETPPDNLLYEWTANVGTFEGTGRVVRWRATPRPATTPVDVVISVAVIEHYQALEDGVLVGKQHRVEAQAPDFRLHDSVAEITTMVVTFLVDYFGNSAVSPEACVVDFSDNCPGKEAERLDIERNREERVILSASASVDSTILNAERDFASVRASCRFEDRVLATGEEGVAEGDCLLTAVYEDRRWWLCSSSFTAHASAQAFDAWHASRGRAYSWPSIARSLRRN